jgi:hypothetical protein
MSRSDWWFMSTRTGEVVRTVPDRRRVAPAIRMQNKIPCDIPRKYREVSAFRHEGLR